MTTLWFCGDTHGSLKHVQQAWDRYGPVDAVIHLGDFDLARPLSVELSNGLAAAFWWIPGNHDFDTVAVYRHLHDDPLVARNLNGKVRRAAGMHVAGLGGNFQGKVWRPPAPPQHAHPAAVRRLAAQTLDRAGLRMVGAIWPDQVRHLAQQRADILVTHEAPSSHRHGFEAIDQLAINLDARLIVHGHHHEDLDCSVAGGRIRVLGVGLRGITDQQGHRVLPGEQSRSGTLCNSSQLSSICVSEST